MKDPANISKDQHPHSVKPDPNDPFSRINYDQDWYEMGGRHALENRVSDLLGFLPESSEMEAIDVGCAEGVMIDFFSSRFARFDGMEKSESLYTKAKEKLQGLTNTDIFNEDISENDLNRDYDYIFFLGVLHYFPTEEIREEVIRKLMKRTRNFLFIRTSFLENRISRPSEKNVEIAKVKSTSLLTIAKLCDELGFRWTFIDNRYRGTDSLRLGDLVVLERFNDPNEVTQFRFSPGFK